MSKSKINIKELLKDSDITNLVITGEYQAKQDERYYNKYKDYDGVEWDISYDKVIDNLSKFGTYFSTCNKETWGITSMEALSCGIPIILNSDKDGDHASEIIPADKSHCIIIPKDDKDALADAIKSFKDIDRKEIQEMTWEKHSLESWKKEFSNKIDRTIENHKKVH